MRRFREDHPIIARRRVKESFAKHPTRHAHQRSASELRLAIRMITDKDASRLTHLSALYDILRSVVLKHQEKSKKLFPFGLPDAQKLGVEFKIGLDRIHSGQLVKNILSGETFKIRWFRSYDDIERRFRGGSDRSILFQSYKDFILWRFGVNNDK